MKIIIYLINNDVYNLVKNNFISFKNFYKYFYLKNKYQYFTNIFIKFKFYIDINILVLVGR